MTQTTNKNEVSIRHEYLLSIYHPQKHKKYLEGKESEPN
jgi:hypothetical protein